MSVLAHVVVGGAIQNEPAATQALAYILSSSPGIARAFVGILRESNIEFDPGRIEAELVQEEDSRPDLTIYDRDGHVRVFIENKFWAPLTEAQPVSYLGSLPEDPPSALVFIVPEQRVSAVWQELKKRCCDAHLDWTDPSGTGSVKCARVGCKAMAVASWEYVLERLLDAARSERHDTVRDDILQLQGLASRMNLEAFLPLPDDEATDQEVARRLINYIGLIDGVVDKLVDDGVADVKGLNRTATFDYIGRYFRMHGEFELWLGIYFKVWRDQGISPLWWWFSNKSGVAVDHFKSIPELFKDVRPSASELYVPIRLKTGVERDRVIDDAVAQMKRIADKVLKTIPNS